MDDDISSPRIDDDRTSLSSQLRKTKSMDASCLDVRAMNDISSPVLNYPLSRAKSDFNLNASSQSLNRSMCLSTTLFNTESIHIVQCTMNIQSFLVLIVVIGLAYYILIFH